MNTNHLPSAPSLAMRRDIGLPGRPVNRGSSTVLRVAVATGLLAAAVGYGAAEEVLTLTAVPPAAPGRTAVVVPTPRPGEIPVVHRIARP